MIGYTVTLVMTLVAIVILLHHEVVHSVLGWAARSHVPPRVKTLVAMVAFILAHNVAIWIFALGYWLGETQLGIGNFAPGVMRGPLDYNFFSAEAYTSVGFDAVFRPTGGIRMIAGMEAVIGLLMIGWSASATYLVLRSGAPRMRRQTREGAAASMVND